MVDVADMDAFNTYLMSEEGAKAKAEDGVIEAMELVENPNLLAVPMI